MRASTSRKIFGHPDWTIEAKRLGEIAGDTFNGLLGLYLINGKTVILQEYDREADGFQVYVAPDGNKLSAVHEALGIKFVEPALIARSEFDKDPMYAEQEAYGIGLVDGKNGDRSAIGNMPEDLKAAYHDGWSAGVDMLVPGG